VAYTQHDFLEIVRSAHLQKPDSGANVMVFLDTTKSYFLWKFILR